MKRLVFPWVVFLLALSASVGVAQTPYSGNADIPARVGRIVYVSGGVQFYAEAEGRWRDAALNEPVTSHNSVKTDGGGRVEIRVGPTALALDANAQLDVDQLDDSLLNARVAYGSVSVRIGPMDRDDRVVVATPQGQIELQQSGRYRIDVGIDVGGNSGEDASVVTVFAGRAVALGRDSSVQVDAGRSLRMTVRDSSPLDFSFGPFTRTVLDAWTLARDGTTSGPASRYVSPYMTGYEDLDANGRWIDDADYGPLWIPTTHLRSDWAPYRYGHWTWVNPWGWTWVDDAPWGFAPFHYGRWVAIHGTWCWTPGAYVARPAFAPALVGFYAGSNFNLSFSIGGGSRVAPAVGWYPLAPWERYAPPGSNNVAYINRVNNLRLAGPPRRFAEQEDFNRRHGASVMPQDAFADRQPTSRWVSTRVPDDVLRDLSRRGQAGSSALLPAPAGLRVAAPRPNAPGSGVPLGVPNFNGPDPRTKERMRDPVMRHDLPDMQHQIEHQTNEPEERRGRIGVEAQPQRGPDAVPNHMPEKHLPLQQQDRPPQWQQREQVQHDQIQREQAEPQRNLQREQQREQLRIQQQSPQRDLLREQQNAQLREQQLREQQHAVESHRAVMPPPQPASPQMQAPRQAPVPPSQSQPEQNRFRHPEDAPQNQGGAANEAPARMGRGRTEERQ